MRTQETIVAESKTSMSEQVRQKEIYEREYKLMKNMLEGLKAEYAETVTSNVLVSCVRCKT